MSKGAGVKVWFDDVCTVKKSGLSAMMKTLKPKAILILPWKVCWINNDFTDPLAKIRAALAETEKAIEINGQLTESLNKKEVTLEFPDLLNTKGGPKTTKEILVFETENAAALFVKTLQEEKRRNYIVSENFTPKFTDDLNNALRQKIAEGDLPLRELYLACHNKVSPKAAVEALFTNYRSMTDFEEPSPRSFAQVLSATAQDPVVFILFLCCNIESGQGMLDHFEFTTGREIPTYVLLFDELFRHITSTVGKAEWKLKRELLLSQFQYPASALSDGTAGIVTPEVFEWTARFTDDYHKFNMDIHTLNRLLVDEKYLCFICLQHHANKGYVQIVKDAFAGVQQEYLFSKFDTKLASSAASAAEGDQEDAQNPWSNPSAQQQRARQQGGGASSSQKATLTDRHHFVDFLFHRNLTERSVFLALLMAFKRGDGFDDKFFTMFLTEAIQMDKPRVAVDVINTILFLDNGEPSVHALKFCPKIPTILFEALHRGVATGLNLSDDLRLLFEIALGFEYFVKRTELNYIKTLSRTFQTSTEKKFHFNALVESMKFLNFVMNVCNHNLAIRAASVSATATAPVGRALPVPINKLPFGAVGMGGNVGGNGANGDAYSEFDDQTITTNSVDEEMLGSAYHTGAVSMAPSYTPSVGYAPSVTPSVAYGGAVAMAAERTVVFGRRGSLNMTANNAGGDNNYSRWMERSDSNLIALVYGFVTLIIACQALPELGATQVIENVTLKTFLESQSAPFYTVLLCPGTHLRVRLTSFLKEQFSFVSLYDELLGESTILCKPQHFSYTFLHALSYHAKFLTHLMVLLVVAALRLQEYDDLYVKLRDLDLSMGRSQEKEQQLEAVLRYVIERDGAELCGFGIQLADLAGFADAVVTALSSVRGNAHCERAVMDTVRRLLRVEPVHFWREGFALFAKQDHRTCPPAPTYTGPPKTVLPPLPPLPAAKQDPAKTSAPPSRPATPAEETPTPGGALPDYNPNKPDFGEDSDSEPPLKARLDEPEPEPEPEPKPENAQDDGDSSDRAASPPAAESAAEEPGEEDDAEEEPAVKPAAEPTAEEEPAVKPAAEPTAEEESAEKESAEEGPAEEEDGEGDGGYRTASPSPPAAEAYEEPSGEAYADEQDADAGDDKSQEPDLQEEADREQEQEQEQGQGDDAHAAEDEDHDTQQCADEAPSPSTPSAEGGEGDDGAAADASDTAEAGDAADAAGEDSESQASLAAGADQDDAGASSDDQASERSYAAEPEQDAKQADHSGASPADSEDESEVHSESDADDSAAPSGPAAESEPEQGEEEDVADPIPAEDPMPEPAAEPESQQGESQQEETTTASVPAAEQPAQSSLYSRLKTTFSWGARKNRSGSDEEGSNTPPRTTSADSTAAAANTAAAAADDAHASTSPGEEGDSPDPVAGEPIHESDAHHADADYGDGEDYDLDPVALTPEQLSASGFASSVYQPTFAHEAADAVRARQEEQE